MKSGVRNRTSITNTPPGAVAMLLLACLVWTGSAPTAAAINAVTIPQSVVVEAPTTVDILSAWQFVPTADLFVLSLGYFDDGNDGLGSAKQVAIYEVSTGALVTEVATVGGAGRLDQRCRWRDITPVMLQAGISYKIAGLSLQPYDPFSFGQISNYNIAASIDFKAWEWGQASTLFFPGPGGVPGLLRMGPNFSYQLQDPVAVEASSWSSVKALYE